MTGQIVPENRPARFPADPVDGAVSGGGTNPDRNAAPAPGSWFATVAVSCGLLGLFILQIVLAPLTIVLSALAWHRVGTDPWGRALARTGYALGILDGVVWLVLESVFGVTLIPL